MTTEDSMSLGNKISYLVSIASKDGSLGRKYVVLGILLMGSANRCRLSRAQGPGLCIAAFFFPIVVAVCRKYHRYINIIEGLTLVNASPSACHMWRSDLLNYPIDIPIPTSNFQIPVRLVYFILFSARRGDQPANYKYGYLWKGF